MSEGERRSVEGGGRGEDSELDELRNAESSELLELSGNGFDLGDGVIDEAAFLLELEGVSGGEGTKPGDAVVGGDCQGAEADDIEGGEDDSGAGGRGGDDHPIAGGEGLFEGEAGVRVAGEEGAEASREQGRDGGMKGP